jgi:hypothetical protein
MKIDSGQMKGKDKEGGRESKINEARGKGR